jgi:GNAT superfamily N-acetyltransferase
MPIAAGLPGCPATLGSMPKSRGRKLKKTKRSPSRPAGRLTAGPQSGRRLLAEGCRGPAGVKLRLARPGESDQADRLLKLAGVGLLPAVAEAIESRRISSALIRALGPGHELKLLDDLTAAVESRDGEGVVRAWAGMATVVVAEDPTRELVGAMFAAPPFEWFDEVRAADVSPRRAGMIRLAGPGVVVKLRSLGVDEAARGAGIGAALVTHCTDLYFELGYRLACGQIRLESGLETYYPKLGFKVLAEGEAIPVGAVLRLSNAEMAIAPLPQERLIARWRTTQKDSFAELSLARFFGEGARTGIGGP